MSMFPVVIEHSANRNSRAIFRDGTIVIRLAKRLPTSMEALHIASLTKRMQRIALREVQKTIIDPFAPLCLPHGSVHCTLSTGEALHIERREGATLRLSTRSTPWTIFAPAHAKRELYKRLWNAVCKHALSGMTSRVLDVNARTLRLPVRAVRMRLTSSQWGSCSGKGHVCLSTALLFVPSELLDYVIIHELAHLEHRNHGTRFWQLVETACPLYASHIKSLRNYRIKRP